MFKSKRACLLILLFLISLFIFGCSSTGKNVNKKLSEFSKGQYCVFSPYKSETFRWWNGALKMDYVPSIAGNQTTINAKITMDRQAVAKKFARANKGANTNNLHGRITFYFCDKDCTIQNSYTHDIKKNITFEIPTDQYQYLGLWADLRYYLLD